MFSVLTLLFITVVAADVFIATSAIRILRRYALPGWTASRLIIPLFIVVSLVFLAFAVYFLFEIRMLTSASGANPQATSHLLR